MKGAMADYCMAMSMIRGNSAQNQHRQRQQKLDCSLDWSSRCRNNLAAELKSPQLRLLSMKKAAVDKHLLNELRSCSTICFLKTRHEEVGTEIRAKWLSSPSNVVVLEL